MSIPRTPSRTAENAARVDLSALRVDEEFFFAGKADRPKVRRCDGGTEVTGIGPAAGEPAPSAKEKPTVRKVKRSSLRLRSGPQDPPEVAQNRKTGGFLRWTFRCFALKSGLATRAARGLRVCLTTVSWAREMWLRVPRVKRCRKWVTRVFISARSQLVVVRNCSSGPVGTPNTVSSLGRVDNR